MQLTRFLRNCSEPSCPWIRESKKWIKTNPCLDRVSSSGEHTGTGGRLKIMQSPSRFLVERCLTHVGKTLDRIYQLKKDVFARVPPPAPPSGPPATTPATAKKEEKNEKKLVNDFVTPLRPPPGFKQDARFHHPNQQEDEEVAAEVDEKKQRCSSDSYYPQALLDAGTHLCQLLLDEGPGPHTPNYILNNYIDQLSELSLIHI